MANQELFPEEKYVIDTCSLVDIQNEDDPAKVWSGLYGLIQVGKLKTSAMAYPEIERMAASGKIPNAAYLKLKELRPIFAIPDDELLLEAGKIIASHPQIPLWRDVGNPADPWIIAAAKMNGWTVVTEENDTGPKKNRRIPWVCDKEGVKWMRLSGLIKKEAI